MSQTNLICFNGVGTSFSIGLQYDGQVSSFQSPSSKNQLGHILNFLDDQKKKHSFEALGSIAYVNGPGSFTGIRMALMLAQGLAFESEVRLIPIGSLEFLSYIAWKATGMETIHTVMNAYSKEFFIAEYQKDKDGAFILKTINTSPEKKINLAQNNFFSFDFDQTEILETSGEVQSLKCSPSELLEYHTIKLKSFMGHHYMEPEFLYVREDSAWK
jgi:tRNA threonylcarbamoyl adenosine modification protein YeaZ